jgi:hypothetical protein
LPFSHLKFRVIFVGFSFSVVLKNHGKGSNNNLLLVKAYKLWEKLTLIDNSIMLER